MRVPATGGRADRALIALLAKAFELRKPNIETAAGTTDRRKTVVFSGPPAATKAKILTALNA